MLYGIRLNQYEEIYKRIKTKNQKKVKKFIDTEVDTKKNQKEEKFKNESVRNLKKNVA